MPVSQELYVYYWMSQYSVVLLHICVSLWHKLRNLVNTYTVSSMSYSIQCCCFLPHKQPGNSNQTNTPDLWGKKAHQQRRSLGKTHVFQQTSWLSTPLYPVYVPQCIDYSSACLTCPNTTCYQNMVRKLWTGFTKTNIRLFWFASQLYFLATNTAE